MSYVQQPVPVKRPRPRWVWLVAGAIFVVIVVVAYVVGQLIAVVGAPAVESRPSSQAAVAVVGVDQAELAKYWDENFRTASWYGVVSMPSWDGTVLTAKTSLAVDGDAKAPAISICGALSGYFVLSGKEFQSVRVLDGAGQVLVSRHSQSDQCTWRR